MIRITTIIGARPQFIKAAALSRVFRQRNHITEILVHTGQHFDAGMSEVFFRQLEIPKPDYNLGISALSHGAMTGRMLEKTEQVLLDVQPDMVLVYGDTNSTLAGALAAAKLHIPVAHVEAGLRSYNRMMPEEINRILTDQLSTLLFCPTETAMKNLEEEGYPHTLSNNSAQKIHRVGDVMYDAAIFYAGKIKDKAAIFARYGLEQGHYVLATIHRAENTDQATRLISILAALAVVAEEIPVILPLHPRTKKILEHEKRPTGKIRFIEPVGYLDMIALEKHAALIVTDSGGVQKEAFFHRVPCVTCREETEWVELVEIGANILARPEHLAETVFGILSDRPDYRIWNDPLYGDGNVAAKIVTAIESYLCP